MLFFERCKRIYEQTQFANAVSHIKSVRVIARQQCVETARGSFNNTLTLTCIRQAAVTFMVAFTENPVHDTGIPWISEDTSVRENRLVSRYPLWSANQITKNTLTNICGWSMIHTGHPAIFIAEAVPSSRSNRILSNLHSNGLTQTCRPFIHPAGAALNRNCT